MRYRLRTLLIVVTLACLMFALLGQMRVVGTASLNTNQVVVCRPGPLGGVGLSENGKSVTADFGNQTVVVDSDQVIIIGLRTVPLPAAWSQVELIQRGNHMQIRLDGKRID